MHSVPWSWLCDFAFIRNGSEMFWGMRLGPKRAHILVGDPHQTGGHQVPLDRHVLPAWGKAALTEDSRGQPGVKGARGRRGTWVQPSGLTESFNCPFALSLPPGAVCSRGGRGPVKKKNTDKEISNQLPPMRKTNRGLRRQMTRSSLVRKSLSEEVAVRLGPGRFMGEWRAGVLGRGKSTGQGPEVGKARCV